MIILILYHGERPDLVMDEELEEVKKIHECCEGWAGMDSRKRSGNPQKIVIDEKIENSKRIVIVATDGQTWVRINKTENSTSTTFLTFASRVVSAVRVCFRFWILRCVRTTSYVKVAVRLSVCSARLSFRPNREEHVASRYRSIFFHS